MKKLILALAIMTITSAGTAMAQDGPSHANGAIGFHNVEAPLGIRWWFSGQKAGIDLGFGFANFPGDIDPDENVNSFAIDAGLIYRFKSWERVHILGRLGLLYQSEEYQTFTPPATIDTETATQFAVPIEIEGEVFLADAFSVSASTGIAFVNTDPGGGGDSSSSFGTIGSNFTDIGFHFYFFGGGQ